MKKVRKTIITLLTLLMILLTSTQCYALNAPDAGAGGGSSSSSGISTSSGFDIFGLAKSFISRGQLEEKISSSQAESDLSFVANILYSVGILTLLITGMIMGVKYMISGADERANMKQKLIWWIIAAVLIFGSLGVYNIVANVFINSNII